MASRAPPRTALFDPPRHPPPLWRLILARVLVVLGALLAAVTILAGYLHWQAFDNDTFEETATALIANDAVRDEIAASSVDALFANVDVAAELESRLPPDQKRLAGPDRGRSPRAQRPRRRPASRASPRPGRVARVRRPRARAARRRPPQRHSRDPCRGRGGRPQPVSPRPAARRAIRLRRQPPAAACRPTPA